MHPHTALPNISLPLNFQQTRRNWAAVVPSTYMSSGPDTSPTISGIVQVAVIGFMSLNSYMHVYTLTFSSSIKCHQYFPVSSDHFHREGDKPHLDPLVRYASTAIMQAIIWRTPMCVWTFDGHLVGVNQAHWWVSKRNRSGTINEVLSPRSIVREFASQVGHHADEGVTAEGQPI